MSDIVIGILGTLLGVVLTFCAQLFIDYINNKREVKKLTIQLCIDTYADAIRYISLCYKNYLNPNDKKVINMADELYYKFHPILTMLVNNDIIQKYNDIRNDVLAGKMDGKNAYIEVSNLLNFNMFNTNY